VVETNRVREAFKEQAAWCSKLGSLFTALVCATLAERLDESTVVGRLILNWEGDPSAQADALPLRVCGALHFLARSNQVPELAALYPPAPAPDGGRLWSAIRKAFDLKPEHFREYLATAPQTNEVGRSAVLMCGFLSIAERLDLPLYLFEIGSSAGLNLIPDRYRYRFGAASWGNQQSPLLLEPQWQGSPPPVGAHLRVAGRCGSDVVPLDVTSDEQRKRLVSYVWADQSDRLARLEAAFATALTDPPRIERMEAAQWVEERILQVDDDRPGARVLFHSILWRYLPADSQKRISEHMEHCGSLATAGRPLAWLRFELDDESPGMALLRLRLWPSGEDLLLATAQAHGKSIVFQ